MDAESLELMERQRKEKCSLIIFIGGEEDDKEADPLGNGRR